MTFIKKNFHQIDVYYPKKYSTAYPATELDISIKFHKKNNSRDSDK